MALQGEGKTQKRVKSGQIRDSDRLFNDLSVHICDKYIELGIELGLEHKVLTNELETGKFTMLQGNKKAMMMFQLWRDSVAEDDFTYSVLAAALEKHGLKRCALEYCYTDTNIVTVDEYDYKSPPESPTENKEDVFEHISSLPSLNVETPKVDDFSLASATNKLKQEFSTLFTKVRLSLQKLQVSPESVLSHLKSVEALGPTFETVCLSARSESFGKAISRPLQSHEDLFPAIAPYCSWFNHLLVENLIETFCEDDEKILQKWEAFKQRFAKYCEARVHQCPLDEFGEDHLEADTTSVVMKIDCHWKTVKINQLEVIRDKISELLDVKPYHLYLRAVKNGCVELLFRVPTFVAVKFIPPSAEQVIALQKVCVIQLRCDPEFMAQRYLAEADQRKRQFLSTKDFSNLEDVAQYLSESALQAYRDFVQRPAVEVYRQMSNIGVHLRSMGDSFDFRMQSVGSTLTRVPLVYAYSHLLYHYLPRPTNKVVTVIYLGAVCSYVCIIHSRYSKAHRYLVLNGLSQHYFSLFVNAPLAIILPLQLLHLFRNY